MARSAGLQPPTPRRHLRRESGQILPAYNPPLPSMTRKGSPYGLSLQPSTLASPSLAIKRPDPGLQPAPGSSSTTKKVPLPLWPPAVTPRPRVAISSEKAARSQPATRPQVVI
ncbi:hypothetical protein TIFTF001_018787 [Ficus carica]|uniref:Uncharacterized protein n=1 Tax=Ficus carica TaxID=3494 RepID=A0AA88DC06_FICCA|nr:hypothetical protein TIFTF001_018787 [Ficus carica]